MCTGISNMITNSESNNQNSYITKLTPNCQNVHYLGNRDFKLNWFNINTTNTNASININDDTQKYMNISEYFEYPYNTSLSIPNNVLFLSFKSFKFDQIGKYLNYTFNS